MDGFPLTYQSLVIWPFNREEHLTPKVHPLAFMGDTYLRRKIGRLRFGFDLCSYLLLFAFILLAYAASGQTEILTIPIKASTEAADILVKKDIAWLALTIAGLAICALVILAMQMKAMHFEYMKQQAEFIRAINERNRK